MRIKMLTTKVKYGENLLCKIRSAEHASYCAMYHGSRWMLCGPEDRSNVQYCGTIQMN